ncbi:MAG: hypothetical protein MO852_15130, partial [Candidatus Devosia euplotis]|nr:hypothetical protein [Candidatus Devosia euplotis]
NISVISVLSHCHTAAVNRSLLWTKDCSAMTPSFNFSRRLTLQLLGLAAMLPLALPLARVMAADTAGRVLILSDLHSAYEHSAHLLAALRREVQDHAVPHIIAINGDVFEAGNVVASRSAGRIDWAPLEALASLAPPCSISAIMNPISAMTWPRL